MVKKKLSRVAYMIISSELIIKQNNDKKKYYIRLIYDDNIIEVHSLSYILDRCENKKAPNKIKEKYNWIKNNHPELFI